MKMNESAVIEKILRQMPIAIGLMVIALMFVGIASAANYAVLINGGVNKDGNDAAFWNDIVFVYDTLVTEYGYVPANIYVLYADGNPPNAGNCRNSGDAIGVPGGLFLPKGIAAVPAIAPANAATAGNLQTVFTTLSGKSDIEKLVVYITNHGGGNDSVKKKQEEHCTPRNFSINFTNPKDKPSLLNLGGKEIANFALWDNDKPFNGLNYFKRNDRSNEVIFDFEFAGAAYLGKIDGKFTNNRRIILDFCHSGGFIDDLSRNDTVIATACEPFKQAFYGVLGRIQFSFFTYYYISALDFAFPNGGAGAVVGADVNVDGRCSMTEAFNWAAPKTGQIPLFDDDGDKKGNPAPLPKGGDGAPGGLGNTTYLCKKLFGVGITAKQPRNVVTEGDDYEIEGIANAALPLIDNNWMVYMDIVLIGPNGYPFSDPGLDVVNGLEITSTPVIIDYKFSKDIWMKEGLDIGLWRAMVLFAGLDCTYGDLCLGDGELEAIPTTLFAGKTQDQIVRIIKDRTIDATGSDDLLVELEFEVEPIGGSRSDNFNHIKIQTVPQKVLIGQNLQFEGFDGTVTVSRIVSGDVENEYQADANNRIYNVNWPTTGAYYVAYKTADEAQLSVEEPDMPLKLKVGTKDVSTIALKTPLTIDTGGMNLFPEDLVDLVIKGPDGQIKYDDVNNQKFNDITVAYLVEHYGDNNLETAGWTIGAYTFKVKTEDAQACGLVAESVVRPLAILKGEIAIEADTTTTVELETVKLIVTGVAGDKINVAASPLSDDVVFKAGIDDTPMDATNQFNHTIDADGTRKYAVEFTDTGSYTIKVTVTGPADIGGIVNPRVGDSDTVDITVLEKEVIFDLPSTVVIGDKVTIKGTATSGTYVSVYIDDVRYKKLENIVLVMGEFSQEVTTTDVGMNVPGSVRLKAWIDCETVAGEERPTRSPDGEDAVLLTTPSLTAELSADAVALEDDFTVFGTAQGATEVTILSVPPKGGGGKSLLNKGETGLSQRKASVSTTDYTYSKKLTVQEDATTGYYDEYVLTPGMDGYWGMTSKESLDAAFEKNYGITDLSGPSIATKTQTEIQDILEDMIYAPGSDDLMVKLRLKVETPYVFLHPIPDVTAPAPLVVGGTSNRKDGYTIVATCISATTELTPQTVQVENGTYSATFDTTDAVTGEYTVKADDGDGHTDEVEVFITGAEVAEIVEEVEEVVEEIEEQP